MPGIDSALLPCCHVLPEKVFGKWEPHGYLESCPRISSCQACASCVAEDDMQWCRSCDAYACVHRAVGGHPVQVPERRIHAASLGTLQGDSDVAAAPGGGEW